MTIQVEQVLLSSLIPYQWNNKIHTQEQVHRIANSIKRFGFLQAIVVDEDSIILAGHGRYQAAQLLKLEKVPVVRKSDLTDSEKKAYRIVDNKTASDTTYDYGNLELEIKSLADAGFDAEVFHFDEFSFEPPPEPEKEPEPEQPLEWVGQFKLKVPKDQIESFEARLDELIQQFDGIQKEVKKVK